MKSIENILIEIKTFPPGNISHIEHLTTYLIKMKTILISIFFVITNIPATIAQNSEDEKQVAELSSLDSLRIQELNAFWRTLAETVKNGDFKLYGSAYHEDGVVIILEKNSLPISVALDNWKQGFQDTKSGKIKSEVHFIFPHRIGDKKTAFEKGMFKFSTSNSPGNEQNIYVNFEAVLVKGKNGWLCIVENQKSLATKEDWDSLNLKYPQL